MNAQQLLRRIPKTELHLHLEGSVDATTLAELASKHGVELPPHDDPEDLYDYDSLAGFLVIYAYVAHAVRDHDDFHRITYETLARCSRDGARYVEMFFSPESHLEVGVPYPVMLEGVLAGMADVQHDLGLESRLVPAINRELGPARAVEFVEMVDDHRRDEVIGISMDFNEVGFPAIDYVEAFSAAAGKGFHLTSHQGEVGPADNVRHAIEALGCERVDHGYAVVEDAELLAACVDSQIPFNVCPVTTTYTTDYRDLAAPNHAVRVMADAGLKITINSDDPPMLHTSLFNEYDVLHNTMGFGLDAIKEFALNGLDASWLDDSVKQQWRREWSAEIDDLIAEHS